MTAVVGCLLTSNFTTLWGTALSSSGTGMSSDAERLEDQGDDRPMADF